MKHRKQTPDIIADLMGEKTSNKASNHANNIAIQPVIHKEIAPDKNNTIMDAGNKASEQEEATARKPESNKARYQASNITLQDLPKEKATFNLSKKLIESLDDAWIMLRRTNKKNKRITKTLLVEVALQLTLNDLQKNKEKSAIYRHIST